MEVMNIKTGNKTRLLDIASTGKGDREKFVLFVDEVDAGVFDCGDSRACGGGFGCGGYLNCECQGGPVFYYCWPPIDPEV